ncbi:mitochondrial import inner membrane translocase subunit Tim13-like [Mercenaria mercenaria]|uniref:mitochondrial import inner membrane translocase subunit Tim13-like n=1 Tax=Mercenaria mercenaria TaxID=6596 RepID=UPI00234F2FDC|nr:mitochondrial import inner membrane translocase subunit Tim13-like [Mercenaria mercenaria]
MDFSSGSKPLGGSNADVDRQLAAVKQQLDLEFMTRKLQKITDKCFQKCITKPGSSLDNSQQKCLAYCMDRYGDTEKLVTQTLVTRLQQEG